MLSPVKEFKRAFFKCEGGSNTQSVNATGNQTVFQVDASKVNALPSHVPSVPHFQATN